MVPNRAITRRICQALRDGQPMDVACTAAGVDAPTLKRWLALGEAADLECEEEDPHCRFFEAFVKALEYADPDVEADRRRPAQPKPEPAPRPRAEPRRPQGDRVSEAPSLVGLVVEEAPIEIVIGSRPPWVYETPPASPTVRSAEPPRPTRHEEASSEEPPPARVEVDEAELRLDPKLERAVEAVGVFVGVSIVLVAIVVLVLVVIPIALASLVLIGAIRLTLGLAYRWRAGILAQRGKGFEGLPTLCRVARNARGRRHRPLVVASWDLTAGSIALVGRLRPQRE